MDTRTKRSVLNRLKRIEGQIRGLQAMVAKNTYCVDIITQSSAVRSALSSVENVMLENHLKEHVVHQMRQRQEKRAIHEVLKVFKSSKRK